MDPKFLAFLGMSWNSKFVVGLLGCLALLLDFLGCSALGQPGGSR